MTRAHAVVLASLAGALLRTSDRDGRPARWPGARWRRPGRPGPRRSEADAVISLGLAHGYLGTAGRTSGRSGPGLALALAHNVPVTALRGYVNLSDVLELWGRHAEAAEAAREGLMLADRAGMVRALGAYLIGNQAEPLLRLGRWGEVDQLLNQALSTVPEGVFAATVLQLRAELAAMRGRFDDAEADLRRPRGPGRAPPTSSSSSRWVRPALIALGRGDLAAAREAVAESLPARPSSGRAIRVAAAVAGHAGRGRGGDPGP